MSSIILAEADTITTGDLDIKEFPAFREAVSILSSDSNAIFEVYNQVEILAINKLKVDENVLDKLPNLKFIQILATGYDNVDLEACRKRGVTVCNVSGYSTYSVAQHVFALILYLTNKVDHHWRISREGIWSREPKFTYYTGGIPELHGKTLGIVGLGTIGRAVADIGLAFGMKIITYTRSPRKIMNDHIQSVRPEELAQLSDIISLHAPLTEDTHELVNAHFLNQMKKSALLINTARGGLIDESALREALESGSIAGAGLDVLTEEPPKADHPLLSLSNCVITCHMAWATLDARKTLMRKANSNIETYLKTGAVPEALV